MSKLRILIIGNGGTGKSTLANRLGIDLSISAVHLDLLSWKDNYERVNEEDFKIALRENLKEEKIIIEGWAFHSTMLERLLWAETIIYLKYPLDKCLESVFKRNKDFNNRKYPFDPFTGDRESNNSLYKTAVEKVYFEYEPILNTWLTEPGIKDKPVFTFRSIEELNNGYGDLLIYLMN